MISTRARTWFAVGIGLVAAALTLVPTGPGHLPFSTCLFCTPRAVSDGLANAVLFIAVGMGLRGIGFSAIAATALGAAASVSIEAAQLIVPGRDPGLSDVVSNTIGAGIGAAVPPWVPLLLAPRTRAADVLGLAAAVLACAVWGLTGYLVKPSFPALDYWGQWTPRLESLEPYRGSVLRVTVGTMAVGTTRVADSAGLRAELASQAPIGLQIVVGPPPARMSSIFSIADADGRRALLIGATGADLVVRYRTRAADWRLDQPLLKYQGALASVTAGDRIDIKIQHRSSAYCVRAAGVERCASFGIGSGWALLVPDLLEWPASIVNRVWIAMIVAPVGFFLRRTAAGAAAIGLLVAASVLVPMATPLAPASASDGAAVLGGLLIGAIASRAGARAGLASTLSSRDPSRDFSVR